LAVEARVPGQPLGGQSGGPFDTVRYAVCVQSRQRGQAEIADEGLALINSASRHVGGAYAWTTQPPHARNLIITAPPAGSGERLVSSETSPPHQYVMRLDEDKTLIDRPPSAEFPTGRWLRDFITRRIYHIALDSQALRLPSPAVVGRDALLAGGNGAYLPWLVHDLLQERGESAMKEWMGHVKTALPDVVSVRDFEREEDRSRFLMVQYRQGPELPSWVISDGTLRLLALTILPHIARPAGVYLIEEPENSLHPHNVETVMQSLQSVYEGQVLVATHSPLVLGLARPEDILVFARDEHKGSTITVGSEHPGLRDWKGEVNLGTLFAGGVLG